MSGNGKLHGKKALVTGSSKGIGKAIALLFGREGADVAINYNTDRRGADEVVAELAGLGRKSFAFGSNVGDYESVVGMFDNVKERWGGIDILVNCAGISPVKPFLEITHEEWREVISTNLEGSAYCTQLALPYMISKGRGWVVNISSVHSQATTPGRVHYAASKGGLEAMTRALAVEYGPSGIYFNAIIVGAVKVERTTATHDDPLNRAVWKRLNPVGRVGEPDEIARAALLLASPDSSFINGATLRADGGKLAKSMGFPDITEILDSRDTNSRDIKR